MAERFNIPLHQVFDSNGDPLSGAKLEFFVSGTSTPLDTYSDNALSSANANPVVADSAGRFGDIFLQSADYKVVLKTSADVTVWTADPVHGGSANPLFSSISVKSGNYTVVAGDNGKLIPVTASATITITAAATLGSGFRVGIVNAGAGIVTVARSSSDTFDAGQTSVKLAPGQGIFVQPDGTSKLYTVGRDGRGKGADIASASTLNLGEDGHYFHVTGTTTIPAIEARPTGWDIELEFDAALTLIHNATSLILPGAANITTAAGDVARFVSEADSGNWRCTSYLRAAVAPTATLYVTASANYNVAAGDNNRTIDFTTASVSALLGAAATLGAGFRVTLINSAASGDVTIDPNSAETLDGQATRLLRPGDRVTLVCTGSAWKTERGRYSFTSAEITVATSTVSANAHGLGVLPPRWRLVLRNKTAELGYSVGDEVAFSGQVSDVAAVGAGVGVALDSTNVTILTTTVAVRVQNKGSAGAAAAIVTGNWRFVISVYDEY